MPEPVIFSPSDRPDVEVLADGVWCAGELRAWLPRDGGLWANASWRTGTAEQYLETVPADRVRQVEVL